MVDDLLGQPDPAFEVAVSRAEDVVAAAAEERPARPKTNAREIFAVDSRAFAYACDLGLNEAVAYLVIAAGTGGDNRTTNWSVNAIEAKTGISRARAKLAVRCLRDGGLISLEKVTRKGRRPHYRIVPAHEIAAVPNADERPTWVWLPNRIVSDRANVPYAPGEVAPIELIRQMQNVDVLRLFVTLYNFLALASEGGIEWRLPQGLFVPFERTRIGERGHIVVWGFKATSWARVHSKAFWLKFFEEGDDGKRLWPALGALIRLGLIECVPHLVEGESRTAEVVHPYAVREGLPAQFTSPGGLPQEMELAVSGTLAARAALTDGRRAWAAEEGFILAPVPAHLEGVQLVGIFRPRYRAQTQATADWMAKKAAWTGQVNAYRALANEIAPAMEYQGTSDLQYQGEIKG